MKNSKVQKFTRALKKVLKMENIVILTDAELLTLVNSKLAKKDRVAVSTFEAWKSKGNKAIKSLENSKTIPKKAIEDFREAMALARVNQKLELADKALTFRKGQNSQGAQWLLTKKFEDLQDKPQSLQLGQGGITLNINNSDKETKGIIDAIDIDFEDLDEKQKPKQLKK